MVDVEDGSIQKVERGASTLRGPYGLKIINLLGRFEIFSYSLGRHSVDGLD